MDEILYRRFAHNAVEQFWILRHPVYWKLCFEGADEILPLFATLLVKLSRNSVYVGLVVLGAIQAILYLWD
jgi:hypothetical protein